MLSEAAIQDITRQALWVAVVISSPILAAALVAGLAIGLLQALTSIQEMTLTFIPKLLVMTGVFWMTMDFMTATLKDLLVRQIAPLLIGG